MTFYLYTNTAYLSRFRHEENPAIGFPHGYSLMAIRVYSLPPPPPTWRLRNTRLRMYALRQGVRIVYQGSMRNLGGNFFSPHFRGPEIFFVCVLSMSLRSTPHPPCHIPHTKL